MDFRHTFRPASIDDVDAILAVAAAAELGANGVVDIDREDIESELALPGVDPARHTLVVEHEGAVVAWAVLEAGRGATYTDVHPAHRGRGIGSRVVAWCEEAARNSGLREVRQTRSDAEPDAQELLRSRGWSPRWTTWMLEYVMGEDEPAAPDLPDGIRIRDFAPGSDDREAHRVVDDAFGEWEGRDEQDFDEWAGHTVGRETFDPRLSPVALDGDEIVGVVHLARLRGRQRRLRSPAGGAPVAPEPGDRPGAARRGVPRVPPARAAPGGALHRVPHRRAHDVRAHRYARAAFLHVLRHRPDP